MTMPKPGAEDITLRYCTTMHDVGNKAAVDVEVSGQVHRYIQVLQ
jgi:hypothetical protein